MSRSYPSTPIRIPTRVARADYGNQKRQHSWWWLMTRLCAAIVTAVLLLSAGAVMVGAAFPGQQLAYVFYGLRDGRTVSDVMLVDVDRGVTVNLSDSPYFDLQPAWSPDGTRVAFVTDRHDTLQIYVVNWDGSGLQRVTSDDTEDHRNPMWSIDGSGLLFFQGPGGQQQQLYYADLTTGDIELVLDRDATEVEMVLDLNLSVPSRLVPAPDGESVLRIGYEDRRWGLYTGREGEDTTRIADLGQAYVEAPVWSPDSRWIAYVTSSGRKRQLYVTTQDGADVRRLFYTAGYIAQVVWRP